MLHVNALERLVEVLRESAVSDENSAHGWTVHIFPDFIRVTATARQDVFDPAEAWRQAEDLRDRVLGAAFRLAYSCRLSAISRNVEDDAGSVTGWRGQVELGLRPVQLL
jgi:hypothetical protein